MLHTNDSSTRNGDASDTDEAAMNDRSAAYRLLGMVLAVLVILNATACGLFTGDPAPSPTAPSGSTPSLITTGSPTTTEPSTGMEIQPKAHAGTHPDGNTFTYAYPDADSHACTNGHSFADCYHNRDRGKYLAYAYSRRYPGNRPFD